MENQTDALAKEISALLSKKDGMTLNLESTGYEELQGNCGKCTVCGAWATDYGQPGAFSELSNGAVVDGKWYCDVCLPFDHPNKF
ncbi:hypothetical protein [Ethanoligenens sp.]|uniref:hypothetical protein n=1 Tax=Ethanoligenens sp. TaxID=2099655 RepID=UPI0039EB9270